MRWQKVRQSKVNWVHLHRFCHFIKPDLHRTTGVHGSVTPHGTRSRFVGPNSSTGVVEGAQFVRRRGEDAVVVRGDVAEGCKAAAVDEGVDVKARDATLRIRCHLDIDVAWVAAAIDPVDLLSVKRNPHGRTGLSCKNGGAHLMRKRIGFSTKTSTHKGADDVDLVHGHLENGGEGSVSVVGDLLGRVELQTAVGVPVSDHSVRLGEAVVNAQHVPGAV